MEFFKVTTSNLQSLGLRKNPTILIFPLGEWVKSPTIKEGNSDDGGIWLAVSLSNARRLKKYMFERYGEPCRIFKATVGQILFKNSYRVKTDKIRCEVEVE
jgi:hypothetical protein